MNNVRCINYPCQLDEGHSGPCSSGDVHFFNDPDHTGFCAACGLGLESQQHRAAIRLFKFDEPGDGKVSKDIPW